MFDYEDIERQIQAALRSDTLKAEKLSEFRRRFFGMPTFERSMTGRYPSPPALPPTLPCERMFGWQVGLPSCPCGMCVSRPPDPTETQTPLHPLAVLYADRLRKRNQRAADEEMYAMQQREEQRRREEMLSYRVKYRTPRGRYPRG
jgi:hypothetical protein